MRVAPEDFVVDELPAYLPSGEGEHLFLKVWKRGLGTPEAAALLAKHFGCPERELSWAGLKDSFAVTTQWLSLPARLAKNVATFEHPQVRVLESKKHGNKLKGGHLEGNRFALRLAGVKDVAAAQAAFARLAKEGIPNAFGTQRFGAHGDNASKGKDVLLGKARVARFQRKLFLSAYQSDLFNRLLERRLSSGTFAKALQGDVLKKHETGGEFVCADAAVDQPRVEAFEVSATGPMYGPKMRQAEGATGEAEAEVLRSEGLTLQSFEAGRGETEGARRFFRVPLSAPELEVSGEDVWLRFALPSGSYATVVLGELLKR